MGRSRCRRIKRDLRYSGNWSVIDSKSHKKGKSKAKPRGENFIKKQTIRKVRKIKTTKSQKKKVKIASKNRNTIEPISHFQAHSKGQSKRMKGSVSLTGHALRGLRGKSPFANSKQQKRKGVIRVSTISYNHTPDKGRTKKRLNKSIINTRIESQKEFETNSGPNIKKQIVYTKRGQEIMDSLISTGKARIANTKDLKEIIKRKNSNALIGKGMKDSPYNYSRKNLLQNNSRGHLERMEYNKYNLGHSKLEPRKQIPIDAHRRVKTNLEANLNSRHALSPSPDNRNDFDGFLKEKIVHERYCNITILIHRFESRRFNQNAGYDLLSQAPTVQINNDSQQNSYMNHSIANKYLPQKTSKDGNQIEIFNMKSRKKRRPRHEIKVVLTRSPSPLLI